jgi:ABC-2 type transport system permease protein
LTRVFLAGLRFQALILRRSPAELIALLTTPLFTLAFAAIIVHAGQQDLAPYAIVGPAVMAIWSMALNVSGDIVDSERHNGTLEATLTTPVSLIVLVLGRITAVTLVSLLSLAESTLIAWMAFGLTIHFPHPGLFALTVALTAAATAGTATAFSGLFVLARSARIFQNSLAYPIYLLSGAMIPPALLPAWLRPITQIMFLSWSTGLMRDAMRTAPAPGAAGRLAVIAALGAVAYTAGVWLLARVLRRVRTAGTVGFT